MQRRKRGIIIIYNEIHFEPMNQDELWLSKNNEVMSFIERNHRDPSKHRLEEHQMLNFVKHNRKLMNKGELKVDRVEMFEKLLEMGEKYKRKNQYDK